MYIYICVDIYILYIHTYYIYAYTYICKESCPKLHQKRCLTTPISPGNLFLPKVSQLFGGGTHPSESLKHPPFVFVICLQGFQTSRKKKEPERRLQMIDNYQCIYIYVCKYVYIYIYVHVMVSSGHLEQIPLFFGFTF